MMPARSATPLAWPSEGVRGGFVRNTVLTYGIYTGILSTVKSTKKITVELPVQLVDQALAASGLGLTPTIRQGLQLIAATSIYEKLKSLKGKLNLSLNLKELRKDRI